jgi:hypothetical protein
MTSSIREPKTARKARVTSKAALGRYLAAGLGATGFASVDCEAAVINLNISALGTPPSNRSGVNGGVANGLTTNIQYVVPFAVTGQINQLGIKNNSGSGYFGLNGAQNMEFLAGSTVASPTNLPGGALAGPTIPYGSSWVNINSTNSLFRYFPGDPYPVYTSPNFGPGSFMGFRVQNTLGQYNYGYFEVTWNNSNNQFQILSGAYESTPNTPIAVPEPSTIALAGIGALALGAGAIRRSRKARKAATEGSLAEAV